MEENKNLREATEMKVDDATEMSVDEVIEKADNDAAVSPMTEVDIAENNTQPTIKNAAFDIPEGDVAKEEGGAPSDNTPKRDNRRGSSAHRLVSLAAFVALAMILSFIESRIPTFVAIPGVKIGLANIVVVFCLYRMRAVDAAIVSLVRVALSSLLFGSLTSFFYGLGGAVVSLAVMILLKQVKLGSIAVSTVGGVSHNIAQIAVASILLGTNVVGYYLPFLILSGTIAGIVVGVAGGILEKKVPLA